MNYQEWEESVPEAIKGDSLWKMEAYRLSLFAGDLGWEDAAKLLLDPRTKFIADQLYRSLGSVGANIAEGYSRGTRRERAHFYEYALGSTRESRDWYYKARHVLGDAVTTHRLNLLNQILRLLLVTIHHQRGTGIREQTVEYSTNSD
jgi:four helix bundle protein